MKHLGEVNFNFCFNLILGMKKSGIGRELGKWGLNNYLETKCVVSNEKLVDVIETFDSFQ